MPTILCYMFSALLLLSFCLAHAEDPNLTVRRCGTYTWTSLWSYRKILNLMYLCRISCCCCFCSSGIVSALYGSVDEESPTSFLLYNLSFAVSWIFFALFLISSNPGLNHLVLNHPVGLFPFLVPYPFLSILWPNHFNRLSSNSVKF
jgi:hypothetical protein